MTMIKIDHLTQQVIDELNSNLKTQQHPNERLRIIDTALNKAFQDLDTGDNKQLYKRLALLFHPDKLKFSDKPFAIVLKKLGSINQLQQILETFKEGAVIDSSLKFWNFIEDTIKSMLYIQLDYPVFVAPFTMSLSIILMIIVAVFSAIAFFIIHLPGFLSFKLLEKMTNKLTQNQLERFILNFSKDHTFDYEILKQQVIYKLKSAEYSTTTHDWIENNKNATAQQLRSARGKIYREIFDINDEDYIKKIDAENFDKKQPSLFGVEMRKAILSSNYNRTKFTIKAFKKRIVLLFENNDSTRNINGLFILFSSLIIIPATAITEFIEKFLKSFLIPFSLIVIAVAAFFTLFLLSGPGLISRYLKKKNDLDQPLEKSPSSTTKTEPTEIKTGTIPLSFGKTFFSVPNPTPSNKVHTSTPCLTKRSIEETD